VDGPEFDAHQVDFETLEKRNRAYKSAERRSLEEWDKSIQPAEQGLCRAIS
jgi:hypothetical protein